MGALHWYIVIAGMTVLGAMMNTGIDLWILGDLPRRKAAAVGARWGFFMGVLSYAWALDSGRIPYSETGIEVALLVGMLVTALLWWAGHRHGKDKRG